MTRALALALALVLAPGAALAADDLAAARALVQVPGCEDCSPREARMFGAMLAANRQASELREDVAQLQRQVERLARDLGAAQEKSRGAAGELDASRQRAAEEHARAESRVPSWAPWLAAGVATALAVSVTIAACSRVGC